MTTKIRGISLHKLSRSDIFWPLDAYIQQWSKKSGRINVKDAMSECRACIFICLAFLIFDLLVLGLSRLTSSGIPSTNSGLGLLIYLVIPCATAAFGITFVTNHVYIARFCSDMNRLDALLRDNKIDPRGVFTWLWDNNNNQHLLKNVAEEWMTQVSRILARQMSEDSFSEQSRHFSEVVEELDTILANSFLVAIDRPQVYLRKAQAERSNTTTIPTQSVHDQKVSFA